MTRLSVIVPGYNTRKEWWVRCVVSLDRALTDEDEIIVVDDGSVAPVQRDWFASKIVTVIRHDKNKGLPTARNTGLAAVKGAFVTFVDSDDEVRSETYSRCIDALKKHEADVAVYGVRGVYVNDGFVVHDVPEDKYYGELTPFDVGYLVKRRLFYYSWNKVFCKSFLDEHEFKFDPTGVPCEDAIFNVRLVREKARWVTVAYEGYIYYRYDGSLLSTYKPTYVEGTRACTKAWRDYKDATPGAYEELDKYGLGRYDETSEEDIVRGQWTNIWRRKSPYSLGQKWRYAREHADVLGRCTLFVFVKKAIVMWLRAHCYWKMMRVLHEKKFLKRIGAKVEPMKRFVSVMNIPSPYRLPLFEELDRQLRERGIAYHVDFMAKGHRGRPRSWLNPKMTVPYKYWRDMGFGEHHFNPGLVLKLILNPPDYLDLGSPYDTFTCIMLALFCRTKVKIMALEGNTKTPGKLDGFVGWFKRLVLKRATYLPVPGNDARLFIAMHQARTKCKLGPTPFLPNIIDENKFKPRDAWSAEQISDCRNRLGVAEEQLLCLIPARLIEVKGLAPFLKLLNPAWLANWRIVIIGQGELKDELLSIIDERGLKPYVQIQDYVDYDDMPIYYAAADLMLLPSIQDMNPLCVVEALFSGLPIALSNMAGNVEEGVSEGRNGWALPVLDKNAYETKLQKVFSTPLERLRVMGQCSLAENSKFWHAKDAIHKYLDEVVGVANG